MLNSVYLMKRACFFFFLVGLFVSMNASANLLFEVLDDGPVGLEWRIVNDNVMGGRSRGDFEISEESLSFLALPTLMEAASPQSALFWTSRFLVNQKKNEIVNKRRR